MQSRDREKQLSFLPVGRDPSRRIEHREQHAQALGVRQCVTKDASLLTVRADRLRDVEECLPQRLVLTGEVAPNCRVEEAGLFAVAVGEAPLMDECVVRGTLGTGALRALDVSENGGDSTIATQQGDALPSIQSAFAQDVGKDSLQPGTSFVVIARALSVDAICI